MYLEPPLHIHIGLVFINNLGIQGRKLEDALQDGIGYG